MSVGVLARQVQVSHADIGAGLTPFSTPWADSGVAGMLGGDAVTAAIDGAVNAQAAMIAYVDVFYLLFWVTAAMMPLVLFLKKPASPPPAAEMVMD